MFILGLRVTLSPWGELVTPVGSLASFELTSSPHHKPTRRPFGEIGSETVDAKVATSHSGFDKLIDWLVAGAPGSEGGVSVMESVCAKLQVLGFALGWCEVRIRTLHPDVAGVAVVWRPDRPVSYRATAYHSDSSHAPVAPPVYDVMETGIEARFLDVALTVLSGGDDHGVLTDCVVMPLIFIDGTVHAVTWATYRPERFSSEQISFLRRMMPAMARVSEIASLRRTSKLLLDTYVGQHAGSRILAGHVHRGHTETMRAAIWLSDMRRFTVLSDALPPNMIVKLLNRVFDCQITAITKQGGEVLKFLGDGILAVFPATADVASACERAMNAAETAVRSVSELDAQELTCSDQKLEISVALHFGDLLYGNVGGSSRGSENERVLDQATWSANRLDFTCVGAGINFASRLERLSSQLNRSIVASEVFRSHVDRVWTDLGEFDIKGLCGRERIFAAEV